MKITVIGAGNVGATTAQRLVDKQLANEVVLVDVLEGIPQGKALDMYEASPVEKADVRVIGTNTYDATANSDIVVITAGIARKPGMSRDDLMNTNSSIVKGCASSAAAKSPNAVFIVVSNPLDVMAYVAMKAANLPRERVIGMAGVLDAARFRSFIALELNVSVEDVNAFVLGGHGDSMVPLPRYSTVAGIPITELLDAAAVDRLVKRTRDGGIEIVNYLKTGSAYYAPGASACKMAQAIARNQHHIYPASVYLQGEYGLEDICFGVPVILGKNGVEKIIALDLNDDEKAAMKRSADLIRSTMAALRF
jgi:malate dehydrogenase